MDVNWKAVESLQRKCFHGAIVLTRAEQRLLNAAMRADIDRYMAFAKALREEFAASFVLR